MIKGITDFIELKTLDDKPTLMMKLYPFSSISYDNNKNKLCDFLSSYFTNDKEKYDILRFVLVELTDNLMKHSVSEFPVDLNLFKEDEDVFVIQTKNFCDEYNYNTYATYAEYLKHDGNSRDKYIQVVKSSALNKEKGGIGLITIVTNYNAKFEFSFNKINNYYIAETKCKIKI